MASDVCAPPRPGGAPLLLLLVGILGISTASLWARGSEASGVELAFRRLALTVPILILLSRVRAALVRREPPPPPLGSEGVAVLASGTCLAVHFSAYFASLARLDSVAVTLVLVSMHPVLLLLIESARGSIRATPRAIGGVLVAFGGAIYLARSEGLREGGDIIGVAYGVLSAVGMVGYLLAGRRAGPRLGGALYARRSYAIAALLLAIVVGADGGDWIPESGVEWRVALLLALFPTVLGHTPMNAALRHFPATVVSTAFLGEVVGASILVWIFLGEVPPDEFWGGGSAIIAGILAVTLSRRGRVGGRSR